jgi:hypothetical protein
MKDLLPSMLKLLNLKPSDDVNKKLKLPNEGSNWKKLKVPIKTYLNDMMLVSNKLTNLLLL